MPDAKRLAHEARATMSRFTGRQYPEFWKELDGMSVAALCSLLVK